MIYINKTAKGFYVELATELDPECNVIGTTWEEYQEGAWVLLTDEQIAFKEANPDASVSEVFNMQLNSTDNVDTNGFTEALQQKIQEIQDKDNESNRFYVSVLSDGIEVANKTFWIDKDLRNSLYSITLPSLLADGETTTKLWTNTVPPESIEVPISWAMEKLPLLEIYAKKTYDRKSENEALAYAATTIEELAAIDVNSDYPLYLTFELNLDLYE